MHFNHSFAQCNNLSCLKKNPFVTYIQKNTSSSFYSAFAKTLQKHKEGLQHVIPLWYDVCADCRQTWIMWTLVLLVRTVFISLPGNWWVELTWLEMHHTWSGRVEETVAEFQSRQCTLPLHTFTLSARSIGAHNAALTVFSCLGDWKRSLCFIFILLTQWLHTYSHDRFTFLI